MANINETPTDENGYPHGEWFEYYENDKLGYHVNYFHGLQNGLYETYHYDGTINNRGYFKMDKPIGYWYHDYNHSKEYYLWLI